MLSALFVLHLILLIRAQKQPNFVVILTDDQDLLLNSLMHMNNTVHLIANQGITFTNTFVNTPICCPSRSTFLTGKYPHNLGTFNNSIEGGCSSIQWQREKEPFTIASFLKQKNYRTFYAGKYLNQYGSKKAGGLSHIPPGYDWWLGLKGNSKYYNYTLSVNGSATYYTNEYLTDEITKQALTFLNQDAITREPFFVMLAPPASHAPFTPAARHANLFTNEKAVRSPPFNVTPVNKHWLVEMPPTTLPTDVTILDDIQKNRLRTLMAVDEMVGAVVTKLKQMNVYDDTYLIFTSDNGFHIGQFTQPWDKRQPYESDIRVPFMISGPKIPKKTITDYPISFVDVAPTILDLAGIEMKITDGASFKERLYNPQNGGDYEKIILIEYWGEGKPTTIDRGCSWWGNPELSECTTDSWCKCQDSRNNTYSCILHYQKNNEDENRIKYCYFEEGYEEIYDLVADPLELVNLHRKRSRQNKRAVEPFREFYAGALARIRSCQGQMCHLSKK